TWAFSSRSEVVIRAFDDPRATRITRKSGRAGILALTHADDDDGIHAVISVVGHPDAIRDPALERAIVAVLAQAGVPARATAASPHRLAVRVPRDRSVSSQQLVHDR